MPTRGIIRHILGEQREALIHFLAGRDGWLCARCKEPTSWPDDVSVDHVQSVKDGGENRVENFRLAHPSCNQRGDADAVPHDPRHMDRKEKFLEEFVESRGSVEAARKATGIRKSTFYAWLREDDLFRERFESYRLALAEEIEDEAVKRVLNPEGQCGSDTLAATLLKGLRPDRYREKEAGNQTAVIIYNSQLREQPRPGVVLPQPDGALMLSEGVQINHESGDNHPQGHSGGDQSGDRIPE